LQKKSEKKSAIFFTSGTRPAGKMGEAGEEPHFARPPRHLRERGKGTETRPRWCVHSAVWRAGGKELKYELGGACILPYVRRPVVRGEVKLRVNYEANCNYVRSIIVIMCEGWVKFLRLID
jgi:hypothetical protein